MKLMLTLFLLSIFSVSPGNAALKSGDIQKSTAITISAGQAPAGSRTKGILKKINDAVASEKSENRESLQKLADKMYNDLKDLEVDSDTIKAARDKSLDWKTRYLALRLIGDENNKKMTKDEELTLYSDALSDAGEHNEVRKLAAQSLMRPAGTETIAREALTKAAKDKNLPGEVLQSVMVSVGYSGIDDTDLLAELMLRKPKGANEMGIKKIKRRETWPPAAAVG